MFERGKQIKTFLKKFIQMNCADEGEKIAVVCHFMVIAALTATGVSGSGNESELKECHWAQNAEIVPMNIEDLNF